MLIIGGGGAGEGAAGVAAALGARVAVVEHSLLGGECSFWACLPTKVLLHSAGLKAAGAPYEWQRASARRDWMIAREGIDYPTDQYHVARLEAAGGHLIRGTARITGPGKVEVSSDGSNPQTFEARNLIVATGAVNFIPPLPGLEETGYWTHREASSLRDLPSSIVILGGGAVGVEMAQVFVRYGVRTTLVEAQPRILALDHPLSSQHLETQLREEGCDVRTGVSATSVRRGGLGKQVELSDGSVVDGAELLVAIGRRPSDLRAIGVEVAGASLDEKGRAQPDDQMRIAPGLFVAGDAAGGLQFTHIADYEGTIAARAAMGHNVKADLTVVPKATYTDPEVAAVGLTVEQAQAAGFDAFEVTQDFAETSRGMTIEGSHGHVTAVIDRYSRTLLGAFAACPGASDIIHIPTLAIKTKTPVDVLADTIHAYPSGARVFMNVMTQAATDLG